jgi:hypothetical protein
MPLSINWFMKKGFVWFVNLCKKKIQFWTFCDSWLFVWGCEIRRDILGGSVFGKLFVIGRTASYWRMILIELIKGRTGTGIKLQTLLTTTEFVCLFVYLLWCRFCKRAYSGLAWLTWWVTYVGIIGTYIHNMHAEVAKMQSVRYVRARSAITV